MSWYEAVLRSEWFWYGLIAVSAIWSWQNIQAKKERARDERLGFTAELEEARRRSRHHDDY